VSRDPGLNLLVHPTDPSCNVTRADAAARWKPGTRPDPRCRLGCGHGTAFCSEPRPGFAEGNHHNTRRAMVFLLIVCNQSFLT
jgi:hypothetical protein